MNVLRTGPKTELAHLAQEVSPLVHVQQGLCQCQILSKFPILVHKNLRIILFHVV